MTLESPFLTSLDERARVKGSRDPIGAQAIWTKLGRTIVGNLTTVSSSVQDFTVLLLGHALIERIKEDTPEADELALFLTWEQIAAYARFASAESAHLRGIDRVKQRWLSGQRISLGISPEAQILSNQKTYGLWGLYTMPARASSLLDGDPSRLSDQAGVAVRPMLRDIGVTATGDRYGLVARLSDPRKGIDRKRDHELLRSVSKLLGPPSHPLRELYASHLRDGGPADASHTQGCQTLLAQLLRETYATDWSPTPIAVETLAARGAPRASPGGTLADRLTKIAHCERLLAPSAALFEYILTCHGQALDAAAADLRNTWGGTLGSTLRLDALAALRPDFAQTNGGDEAARRWLELADHLAAGRFTASIERLVDLNALTMRERGASGPWIVVRDGRLDVRLGAEGRASLPAARELSTYWRHPYFIPSLRAVALALEASP